MTNAQKLQSQFLLAVDVIVALSAEMGHGMMDYSEVGEIEGRTPYLNLIRMTSEMTVDANTPDLTGLGTPSNKREGIPQELRDLIWTYRMDSQFSEDLNEILEAFVDGVDLIWEVA